VALPEASGRGTEDRAVLAGLALPRFKAELLATARRRRTHARYPSVPVNDLVWNNPYLYKCPGDTGDYDLISYGADGQPGGVDKDADISANCEASLIATWYEYTPTNAMDIGITVNQPNTVPPGPSPGIA
jgi:hypothetical protein